MGTADSGALLQPDLVRATIQARERDQRVTVKTGVAKIDDAALVRAAQAGDQTAFEQLVRLYDQPVLRLALNMMRSEEDARDCYQEAFLKVYKSLANFRFECSFYTWTYRIVTNIC